MKDLEIVIPVKNEEKNIPLLVRAIHDALNPKSIDYRMIFVVDKSNDKTLEVLKEASAEYPILIHEKKGLGGKGFSLMEGVPLAESEFVAFIDGDLQYPATALPEMLEKARAEGVGVVVANRKVYKAPLLRLLGSKANVFLFGRLMLGLKTDMQSGLKVFRKDIFPHINAKLVTPWTFDIPLLHAATELGYQIENHNIEFENRQHGASHVGFVKTALAIAKCSVKTRLTARKIYQLDEDSIIYRKKKYTTHTELSHTQSAIYTLVRAQKFGIFGLILVLLAGFILNPMLTASILIAFLSAVYFIDVIFNLFVVLKSLHFPPELSFDDEQLAEIDDSTLPVYTVMCPLYKEPEVLGHFINNMKKMDWPKEKLEVLMLLEENDPITLEAAKNMEMPSFVKVLVVPHSMPKTKPKACNYGLKRATGEYVVVYDAEDQPEPTQLKKAYLAFKNSTQKVFCVQAKLNYFNPSHNILTRLFTAEYSLWFDVILPGLQSIDTTIPLGGTSNHFRTAQLQSLHGWDAFNVTEDCDLGVRLFKEGYKTEIIDSTTLEEANSDFKNWIRQRSRWLKGYMQTYFVHMREPVKFAKNSGWHTLIFQLVIGLRIYFMLINPILWFATISYFVLYQWVGPTIEALYPTWVFYMAAISLVFGNFTYLYNYMIGCAKRGHWDLIKFVFLIPFYWIMMSIAAVMAFYQLIFKPHHWEKTVHGLHLKSPSRTLKFETPTFFGEALVSLRAKVSIKSLKKIIVSSGGFLVLAGILTNFLNYFYNAVLSRKITLEDFGLMSLISSLFFISSIPLSALSRTMTNRVAIHLGETNKPHYWLWKKYRTFAIIIGLLMSAVWILCIPLMASFFNVNTYLPFLIFTPVWFVGLVSAIDSGYLTGNQRFFVAGVLLLSEALAKLFITYIAVVLDDPEILYFAVPGSLFVPFLIGWYFASSLTAKPDINADRNPKFPVKFYITSVLIKFSMVAFLSFDVMLAKHYLSPKDAGSYALISLVGKMIFFVSGLLSQFITPIISKEAGKHVKNSKTFLKIFISSLVMAFGAYVVFGLLGYWTAPILLGNKMHAISFLLPIFGLSMFLFSITSNLVSYFQIKEDHTFPIMNFVLSIVQVIGIVLFHRNLFEIVYVMLVSSVVSLVSVFLMILLKNYPHVVRESITNFFGLFKITRSRQEPDVNSIRILIFNWRDSSHRFAGGAEVYIEELSKRLVTGGHQVTIFCGNDLKNPNYEEIEGVKIHRRGGFYTVYLWAFIYYVFKLKKTHDIVIDVENGIPFFTPLFVSGPKALLIFHIHQEIFLNHLKLSQFGVGMLGRFLEKYVMPLLYRNIPILTISETSKSAIMQIFSAGINELEIINPGITHPKIKLPPKSKLPVISYVGRLKPHKNVDTLLYAFAEITKNYPEVRLKIAGDGESAPSLKRLARKLMIKEKVEFLGRISEAAKLKLYSESWLSVQPSSIEGWGITVIESNSCGTPVIASDVPGLKNSVLHNKTGLLVPPKDPMALSKSIVLLLNNKSLRTNLSREALLWSKEFDWDISTNSLHQFLIKSIFNYQSSSIFSKFLTFKGLKQNA